MRFAVLLAASLGMTVGRSTAEVMPLLVLDAPAKKLHLLLDPERGDGVNVEILGAPDLGSVARVKTNHGRVSWDVTEITRRSGGPVAFIARVPGTGDAAATGEFRWSNPVVLPPAVSAPHAPGSIQLAGVGGLTLLPAPGSIVNGGGIQIRGTVTGNAPPYRMTFFLDGLLTSRLTALPVGQTFAHGLTLVGEGSHTLEVESRDSAGLDERMTAGTITLDRTPPPPPFLLAPLPGSSTNQDVVTLMGRLAELDQNPGNMQFPGVTIVVSGGVRVEPSSSIRVTDPAGVFTARLILTGLPDGDYPIRLISQDEAGNFSNGTTDTDVGVSGAPRAPITTGKDDPGLAQLRRHLVETRRSGAPGSRQAEAALRALQRDILDGARGAWRDTW